MDKIRSVTVGQAAAIAELEVLLKHDGDLAKEKPIKIVETLQQTNAEHTRCCDEIKKLIAKQAQTIAEQGQIIAGLQGDQGGGEVSLRPLPQGAGQLANKRKNCVNATRVLRYHEIMKLLQILLFAQKENLSQLSDLHA